MVYRKCIRFVDRAMFGFRFLVSKFVIHRAGVRHLCCMVSDNSRVLRTQKCCIVFLQLCLDVFYLSFVSKTQQRDNLTPTLFEPPHIQEGIDETIHQAQ